MHSSWVEYPFTTGMLHSPNPTSTHAERPRGTQHDRALGPNPLHPDAPNDPAQHSCLVANDLSQGPSLLQRSWRNWA